MERLHRLIAARTLPLVLSCLWGAQAADYCSLAVRVLSPDNRRLVEVSVSVREKGGRVVEKETSSEDLQFCDLGIAPVTVTVGSDICNQVIVNDVPIAWEEQYVLKITYDPEPCMPERPPAPVPACQVLFRVSDASGNWLENASIQFEGVGLPLLETDKAGRALRLLKVGDRVIGTVALRGYINKTFSVLCSLFERVHEQFISLDRSPSR